MTSANRYDAVVVGAGPNGLAAAITIAQAGRSVLVLEAKAKIGGGARTEELTLPSFHHDVCSAVHPLALLSPFFRSLDLATHGLQWVHPEAPLAHPLDDAPAVLLERSWEATADELEEDARSYRQLIGPLVRSWEKLVQELLKPLGIPRHPFSLMRFVPRGIRSAISIATSWFKGRRARALFAGNAAHAIFPLEHFSSAGFGLMLSMSGHAVGWPVVRGGSQAFTNALALYFESLGGTIKVNSPVSSVTDLPRTRAIFLDLTPLQLARIKGLSLPSRYRERLLRHRYGPGVFKVDWALEGPIPWKDPRCMRAGTLHLGGTLEEIAFAEREVWRGVPPLKPFVLVTQPSLFDPSRAPAGFHTAWAYCHVPNGCPVDMTQRIEEQVERFAPGFRDRILARHTMSPAAMEAYNPNYIGGDFAGGVQSFQQLFVRPLGRWQAYATPMKGLYICSSSMPPGAGVHGMCGHLAAKKALKEVL